MSGRAMHMHVVNRLEESLEQAASQYAAHERQLLRFCRKLTGSAWEAEDLAQTTWIKVWTSQLKRANNAEAAGADAGAATATEASISSSYLYRIAANAWTDNCRRRKAQHQDRVEPIDEIAEKIGPEAPAVSADTLQDAMERLVALLPPRQRIIVLLIEALRFTSAEAADLLSMTEGAVKAALHRARATLSQARGSDESARSERRIQLERTAAMRGAGGGVGRIADEAVVYAYLEAFRTRNVHGLLQLLNAETASDVLPAVQGIQLAPIRAKSGGGAVRAIRKAAAPIGSSSLALAA